MNQQEFKRRTRELALRIIRLAETLPRKRTSDIIARQLIRSATSVGANYRATCRSRSTADMIAKLGIVLEEADETLYWLELLRDSGMVSSDDLSSLMAEVDEIIAMTVTSLKTLRSRS